MDGSAGWLRRRRAGDTRLDVLDLRPGKRPASIHPVGTGPQIPPSSPQTLRRADAGEVNPAVERFR
jgi:hypothetical protein